jgi:3-oxoacyl-[acyl-carrier-protein] synthase II
MQVLVYDGLNQFSWFPQLLRIDCAGYGASCDAYHITSPDPQGDGLRRAILACLKDGDIKLDEVEYINAHGTSTKKNDQFETIAYKQTFGCASAPSRYCTRKNKINTVDCDSTA